MLSSYLWHPIYTLHCPICSFAVYILESIIFSLRTQLGLSTVHHIDDHTVAVYNCHHHTIKAFSIFGLYTAMAKFVLYSAAFYGHIWPKTKLDTKD